MDLALLVPRRGCTAGSPPRRRRAPSAGRDGARRQVKSKSDSNLRGSNSRPPRPEAELPSTSIGYERRRAFYTPPMNTAVETTAPQPASPTSRRSSAPHLSPILGRYFQRSWERGEGHELIDTAGRRYLDFASGIATTSLGHHHPAVTKAIHEQVDKLLHICNALGYLEPVGRLAEMIADVMPEPLDTVFFANSGSEAIEASLKLARRVTGRPGLIAFSGGFHGRTFGSVSVTTSNINYRTGYEPLLPSVYIAPYPERLPRLRRRRGGGDRRRAGRPAADLRRGDRRRRGSAGILIEPSRARAATTPRHRRSCASCARCATEHGILLIADEVQCGYAPDREDVGLRARRDRPRRRLPREGDRQRPATLGDRDPARAAGALGRGRARLDVRRQPRLVRGRRGGPRDDPRAGPRRQRGRHGRRLLAGLKAIMAEEPRIGDVRGPGPDDRRRVREGPRDA